MEGSMTAMTIGRLAREAGVNIDTCPGHGGARDCPIIAALDDEVKK
jgi:hypothetical protein